MFKKQKKRPQFTVPAVIIPGTLDIAPEPYEIEVAWILARHFSATVEFLKPVDGYKIKTADIVMNGLMWEIKSPIGNSVTSIGHHIAKASKQSKYIVFDARRAKLPDSDIEKRLQREFRARRSIQRLLLIKKTGEVVEVFRSMC
jgi:hypothetical protein